MTQTAVEWYAEQDNLLTISFLEDKITQADFYIKKLKLLEQAKQMEKEQMEAIREMLVQGALTNMSCASAIVEFDKLTKSK